MTTKPQFKVSYRGEAEYTLDGVLYRVRYFANDDGHYNKNSDGTNYYDTGIEPFVGTVSYAHDDGADHFHCFPAPEVISIFAQDNPEIVGARYAPGRWDKVEYTAPRQIARRKNSAQLLQWGYGKYETIAAFHVAEMRRFSPEN